MWQEDIQSVSRTPPVVTGGGHRESRRRDAGASRSKEGLHRQAARKWRPQSHICKELNLAAQLHEIGSRFIPRASRKQYSSANTMILTL